MKLYNILAICLIGLLFLYPSTTKAQSTINIGANVSTGSRGFLTNGKRGLGASIEYTNMIRKNGAIRVYGGCDWFDRRFPGVSERTKQDSIAILGINGYDISFLPLRMGYEQFLFKDAAFVYVEAGVSRLITQYAFAEKNLFTYATGAGYRFLIKGHPYLQLSFSYNYNKLHMYRNLNYFSFRAAYGWSFLRTKK